MSGRSTAAASSKALGSRHGKTNSSSSTILLGKRRLCACREAAPSHRQGGLSFSSASASGSCSAHVGHASSETCQEPSCFPPSTIGPSFQTTRLMPRSCVRCGCAGSRVSGMLTGYQCLYQSNCFACLRAPVLAGRKSTEADCWRADCWRRPTRTRCSEMRLCGEAVKDLQQRSCVAKASNMPTQRRPHCEDFLGIRLEGMRISARKCPNGLGCHRKQQCKE
mmetsp:Transcript_45574/g.145386  ORF Transcript_45574/g.145386 Transcript_45574/m.145386 type:complete len:222 (-) Transcript_45574:31-696(-)